MQTLFVQALLEFVGGGDLSMKLRPGGVAVDCLREYSQQMLEVLWYLHGKSILLKDIRVSHLVQRNRVKGRNRMDGWNREE